MSILDTRKNLKPFEYDVVDRFAKPIWDAFWTVDHYKNEFTQDVQEFHVELLPEEREVIKRTSLAIAQIEVKVKEFWSKIGDYFPKPEFKAVGYVFASNEVVHEMAYSQLLEYLGFNDEFRKLDSIPVLNDRVEYLSRHASIMKKKKLFKAVRDFVRSALGKPKKVDKDFVKSLILFSLFIENVSLFSQFYVFKSFKKKKNFMKACNTVVTATAAEENLHAQFGMYLINVLRDEHPEFFTPDIELFIIQECKKAFSHERKVIKWMLEPLQSLPEKDRIVSFEEVEAFDADRYNKGLEGIGIKGICEVDEEALKLSSWFDEGLGNGRVDFFNSRPTSYSIGNSFSPENCFPQK